MPSIRSDARLALTVGGLVVALLLLVHVALGGTVRLGLPEIAAELLHGPQTQAGPNNLIVWQIRLPRALGTLLVGASLSLVGAAFQSLFRNPLAEPFTVGASGGATVGGTLAFMAGWVGFGSLGVMGGAMVGALVAVGAVVSLGRSRPQMLLAGVVVGTLTSSLTTVLLLASGHDTNEVMRWLLGSTAAFLWPQAAALTAAFVIGAAVLVRTARALNVMASSEVAEALGVDGRRVSRLVLVTGAVLTAATVGAVGLIGFVGMVGPLIARRLLGADARFGLPMASVVGAGLLLAADLLAQSLVRGRELPVGAVTAVLGAPVFLLVAGRRE